jgi:hypothetical protein
MKDKLQSLNLTYFKADVGLTSYSFPLSLINHHGIVLKNHTMETVPVFALVLTGYKDILA